MKLSAHQDVERFDGLDWCIDAVKVMPADTEGWILHDD